MKKRLLLPWTAMLLVLCITLGLASTVSAAYPKHTDYIYDGADVLSDSLKESIKSTNTALHTKVKTRIFLCIVETLGGEQIDTYAHAIYNEWKLPNGVLLVISTGDRSYYAIQSKNVGDVLSNVQLESIMTEFFDPDFLEGNTAKAVQKTVNKLAAFLKSELPAVSTQTNSENPGDTEKVTFGSIVLSILRILGWTLVVLLAAFVIFFIAALFNDTAAKLLYALVFSHFTGKKKAPASRDYYDERLYGKQQNNPRQPQRRTPPQGGAPRPNDRRPVYNRYQQGGIRYDDEYYGTRQITRPPKNRDSQQTGQASNLDFERTRQVSIPSRRQNNGRR